MSHIALAWEIGGGFGHIARLQALARRLLSEGHKVSVYSIDLATASKLLGDLELPIYQAPRLGGVWPPGRLAASHAEILGLMGYLDYHRLRGCILAWQHLFELTTPDLLVADYSPTALIAARICQLPSLAIGDSFEIPPDHQPLPSIQPWSNMGDAALRAKEQPVLDNLNHILREFKQPPVKHLYQVFRGDNSLLFTLPELDHFGHRNDLQYHGVYEAGLSSQIPEWPVGKGPKLFIYMPAQHKQLPPLVNAIRKFNFPTVLHIRNLPAKAKKMINSGCCKVYDLPVNLPLAAKKAELVITHGGHGTCAASLMAGTKMLTLPTNLEQQLLAFRLSEAGLVTSWMGKNTFNPELALKIALETEGIQQAVSNLSAKYEHLNADSAMDTLQTAVMQQLQP
ncbi:MAG: hypothetical protein KUG79_03120 [Pseudomonadales bacterium]|nr:hypothetical protein [Pseudomonadales bacterium]